MGARATTVQAGDANLENIDHHHADLSVWILDAGYGDLDTKMSKTLYTVDTVEFQNDVELAVKNILTDGANVEFISSQDEYYREIYNLRRGLYQLGSSSLANLTNITSIEMAFQPEPLLNYTLTPFTLDEPFAKMINTTQGGISLDLELHVICKMKFSMVLTHLDAQRDGVLDVYNVDYTVVIDNSDHSGLATYTISQFLYTGRFSRSFVSTFWFHSKQF